MGHVCPINYCLASHFSVWIKLVFSVSIFDSSKGGLLENIGKSLPRNNLPNEVLRESVVEKII